MSRPSIIADAGVIVGLIDKSDQWHRWATENASSLFPPFITCEAVIVECCYLLQNVPKGESQVLRMIANNVLQIGFSIAEEATNLDALMTKYSDLPMSLADACLVRMSEIYDHAAVFTVDQDFLVYRKQGRKRIPLISPFEM